MNKNPKLLLLASICIASLCGALTSCAAANTVPPDPAAEATGKEPVKRMPSVSFDLLDGVCATTPDGKYKVCGNPLLRTFTIKRTGAAGTYSLKYDTVSKDFYGDLPDGSRVTYKPGGKIVVSPPPNSSGKTVVHPLLE